MKTIKIETKTDSHDCETCGGSWADGGSVYIDGELILHREPLAYCYGVPSYSESDLLVMALAKVGIEVLVDGSKYQICSHDDEYHGKSLEAN